jgi:hypothetical protein
MTKVKSQVVAETNYPQYLYFWIPKDLYVNEGKVWASFSAFYTSKAAAQGDPPTIGKHELIQVENWIPENIFLQMANPTP